MRSGARAAWLSGHPQGDEEEAGTVVNFLAGMEAVVLWSRLHQLMAAHYIKASPKKWETADADGDDAWYRLSAAGRMP